MLEFLTKIPGVLEVFLNVLEFLAVIASVITFFVLMINKFSKALKKILVPCGMGFWPRIRALFLCRKSQIKKRAFIEYALLKTNGYPVINSEWNMIINSFRTFYTKAEQEGLKYSVPNCTPLIDPEFSKAVKRYFDYFSQKKVRKAFGISEEQMSWVMKIHIEEAYATPTCLLTGLLSQYDESWEEFIKRYVSTAYITENGEIQNKNVLSNELYFTFAWLLWGPSYELEYKKYWAGLCQLSYGDESNSIPAIADTSSDVAERLKNKFVENEERRYGALISAEVSIYDKKPFFAALRSGINPNNTYFYDKVENGELSFGVRIDEFIPCLNYKAKKYYSTAYVWILFELEDDDFVFQPEKSVAFFEHANLANKVTYQFLIDTLIEKSIKHFESVYAKEENAGRRYRFVCAMNDKIALACQNKYKEVMASGTAIGNILKEKIEMEPIHASSEVFSAYDEFFAPSKSMVYEEIVYGDRTSLSDLGQFYTEIYMEAFPNENERETFDHFLGYLRKAANAKEYKYHIVLAKNEQGRIVGGCVFNYFKKSNAGVIEFLAIRRDLQSSGLGSQLYRHAVSMLSEDAYDMNRKPLDYICCEIDAPEYSKAEIKKYLYFWNKNNYWHLKFKYIQPALSVDQDSVEGLWFTISPQREWSKSLPGNLIADIVYDYIKYAMGIDNPENCAEFAAMKEELLSKKGVELQRII